MTNKNYEVGQEVLLLDIHVKAKVLNFYPLYNSVRIETLEDYISPLDGKIIKAGIKVEMPENLVQSYAVN